MSLNRYIFMVTFLFSFSPLLHAKLEIALTELSKTLKNLEQTLLPMSDPDKETFDKYPKLFAHLPLKYKKIVLEYFEKKDLFKNPATNIDNEINRFKHVYQALGNHFNILIQYVEQQDYNYFDRVHALLLGRRTPGPEFIQFDQDGKLKPWTEEQKRVASLNYKIHLMPKPEDILVILIRLLEEVQKKQDLAYLLSVFKIKSNLKELKDNYDQTLPVMVLYPSDGKDSAQQLLNIIYSLFKDISGLDITPRYNQKVTDLIYFAQGDADDKNVSKVIIAQKKTPIWAEFDYFEQPDMIYFKPDFVTPGKSVDYHLKIPTGSHPKT